MKKKLLLMAVALLGIAGFSASAQNTSTTIDNAQAQNKMRQPREFTEFAFEGILLDMNQQARIDSLNAAVKANAPQCAKKERGPKDGCDGKPCANPANCKKGVACPDSANCPNKNVCPEGAKCKKGVACADPANCPKNNACTDGANCKKGKACADSVNCPKKGLKVKSDKKECALNPRGRQACPYGKEYVEKVKEILTPDQYTLFLENIAVAPCPLKADSVACPSKGIKKAGKACKKASNVKVSKAAK